MKQPKPPLVVLTGPTAVGKTDLSIRLAKRIGGEIISADSMQVYRGMDIGTAKISEEEKQGVPHFLLDELEPWEEFHVALFQQKAKQYIKEIYGRGHIPILVGGTGFYIQSVLYDIDFKEPVLEEEKDIRQDLEKKAQDKGEAWLHEELEKVDPVSAGQIHPHNVKRVIRALEYYRQTGEPISAHNAREREKESPYAFCYFVLNQDRSVLYERIDERIEKMMEAGLLEEVARLRGAGCNRSLVSMQGLGYKELLAYLEGEYSLEEAVYRLKRDTRHFAKRQLTWFGREREVIWIQKEEFPDTEAILEFMIKELKERVY
ncbi:MAG: tRNA (adenosine(37)-N6)-dimethylallyltransferase MiaA [Lachnospiraceae bacterium]|jgi:tRNA dimethylallyltransferase|nr:tRNA (adenosine(37)-N6)-dimethylallyltransferase MiaA [Lachnospiraceae bacterium]MCX4318005.1 tRNA (adenosine(37)-N6)-dimethylallyltransferase MiaA [Lachnospiraceae bacterium]